MSLDLSQPPPPPKTLEEAYQWMLAMWHEMVALRAENAALRAENAQLKERVAHLEEQLRLNSSTSSKPPSSDPPWRKKKPPPAGDQPKRRHGGQPGHPGHAHEAVPSDQVTRIVEVAPPLRCPCGGEVVVDWERVDARQVQELPPPPPPEITEFRRVSGCCQACGSRLWPAWPAEALHGMGPRLAAVAAYLSVAARLSKSLTVGVLRHLLAVRVSVAALSANEARVSQALAAPVQEAHDHVKNAAIAHADESSWRQGNADGGNESKTLGWIWVGLTTLVTVFLIQLSRGQEAAKVLLGATFKGRLVADRYNAYNFVDWYRRQLCWAHLKRDFERIVERSGESARIGNALLAQEKALFALWYRVRDGTLKFSSFGTYVVPIRQRVRDLLGEAAAWPTKKKDASAEAKTARTCKKLLQREQGMWVFTHVEDMDPTNNRGEQAIRPAVLYRKVSLGTQSARGSRFVARMFTVIATCRQQGRDVLDYLTAAIVAHRRGLPAPSLLPAPAGDLAAHDDLALAS
jgi:transposase